MRMADAASTAISVARDGAAPVDLMLVVFCEPELMGHEDGSGLALGARQSKLGPFGIATSPMLHTCGKRTEIATPQQAPFPPILQSVDCTLHTAHCTLQNGLSIASHQKVHNYLTVAPSKARCQSVRRQKYLQSISRPFQNSPFKHWP